MMRDLLDAGRRLGRAPQFTLIVVAVVALARRQEDRAEIEEPNRITAHLRDGATETTVTSGNAQCFWNEPTGQYWWMFRLTALLDVTVLWSSGTVTGWRHVFRAADEIHHITERVREQLAPA